MKMDGQTVHRTGPASWMPPANFGKVCSLVALIVANHGHNFKGKLGQTHNEWAPTLLRRRYKSRGWAPSCVRTCHKPRPSTRPCLPHNCCDVPVKSLRYSHLPESGKAA